MFREYLKQSEDKSKMICQSEYDSFDAIPEALRDEFHQVGAKWQLKESAIPGVGPLFNKALAANSERQQTQLATQREANRTLTEKVSQLEDKLAVLDTPGNKVLSKTDADSFDAYVALGTPTEIKARLEKLPELEGKVQKFETSESLGKVVKASGLGDISLNPEVLSDWLAAPENKGISAFVKTVEQPDGKGGKVQVEVPYLRIEKSEDGKTNVSEKELLTFAKEAMPEWRYNALVAAGTEEAGKTKAAAPSPQPGVKVPNLGSARKEPGTDGDKKRPVDKFNEARAAKPNPFAPKAGQQTGAMPIIR